MILNELCLLEIACYHSSCSKAGQLGACVHVGSLKAILCVHVRTYHDPWTVRGRLDRPSVNIASPARGRLSLELEDNTLDRSACMHACT